MYNMENFMIASAIFIIGMLTGFTIWRFLFSRFFAKLLEYIDYKIDNTKDDEKNKYILIEKSIMVLYDEAKHSIFSITFGRYKEE